MLTGITLVALTGNREAKRQKRELESAIKLIYQYDFGEPPSTAKRVIRVDNDYCRGILDVLIKAAKTEEEQGQIG